MQVTKNKKRVAGLAIAGLLVAGAIGTGAVTTLNSSITGNQFTATMPEDGKVTPESGAKVVVNGDALVHDFTLTKYNESVQGSWTISNEGKSAAPYDGQLNKLANVSQTLAENLSVEYGQVANGSTNWIPAGTLADPVSYATALQLGNPELAPGASQVVPVRITLADPTLLEGEANEALRVDATFRVDYVDTTVVP